MVCNLLLNVSLYNLLETIGVTSYIYRCSGIASKTPDEYVSQ